MDDRLLPLNTSFINEIIRAMGLPNHPVTQSLIRLFFEKSTLRFADIVLGLDREIEQHGSMQGARWLLKHFITGFDVNGAELIPKTGPLIIASNHPASYDALVITACIPRRDFKIIIGEIPPYQFVPHISSCAIFSPNVKNTFGRMQTIRNAIRHLKSGGALLIFPRGGIEPDPAFMPAPDAEFDHWSRSLEIFIKNAPETQVLATAVSGVISERIFNHPITWFRKSRPDRQRLAFMYQILRQALSGKELFGLRPRVTFGELLSRGTTLAGIEDAARRTLKKHLQETYPVTLPDLASAHN
ncbi:MAG: 1-acyl-sn-glycerol-3-phosphate acyltransferase [Anaerolineae bacterium]|nr:1-acyl-sn-glycerol-3-phosphate acyltransferase [Anaerolineae bacterium]